MHKLSVCMIDTDCWGGCLSKQTNHLARLTCYWSEWLLIGLAGLLDFEKKKSDNSALAAFQKTPKQNKKARPAGQLNAGSSGIVPVLPMSQSGCVSNSRPLVM